MSPSRDMPCIADRGLRMVERQVHRRIALSEISNGAPVSRAGRHKFSVLGSIVHVRFCSGDILTPNKFLFTLHSNILTAAHVDYELWVCGNADVYYLIPVKLVKKICNFPGVSRTRHDPDARIVSVNSRRHVVTYAPGGKNMNLRRYFKAKLRISESSDNTRLKLPGHVTR